MDTSRLWTWADVSELLRVPVPTLRKWYFLGRLPGIRLGDGRRALVRFRPADIEAWIEQRRVGGK